MFFIMGTDGKVRQAGTVAPFAVRPFVPSAGAGGPLSSASALSMSTYSSSLFFATTCGISPPVPAAPAPTRWSRRPARRWRRGGLPLSPPPPSPCCGAVTAAEPVPGAGRRTPRGASSATSAADGCKHPYPLSIKRQPLPTEAAVFLWQEFLLHRLKDAVSLSPTGIQLTQKFSRTSSLTLHLHPLPPPEAGG